MKFTDADGMRSELITPAWVWLCDTCGEEPDYCDCVHEQDRQHYHQCCQVCTAPMDYCQCHR